MKETAKNRKEHETKNNCGIHSDGYHQDGWNHLRFLRSGQSEEEFRSYKETGTRGGARWGFREGLSWGNEGMQGGH
jgi:hypothetical protein